MLGTSCHQSRMPAIWSDRVHLCMCSPVAAPVPGDGWLSGFWLPGPPDIRKRSAFLPLAIKAQRYEQEQSNEEGPPEDHPLDQVRQAHAPESDAYRAPATTFPF